MSSLLVVTPVGSGPFLLLLIGMATVIFLITVARLHAFLALILSALTVGLLTPAERFGVTKNSWVAAIDVVTKELGTTAGKIGLVIALASIIGMCLGESGAADKVVRRFLAVFGEKRAGVALLVSSYVLSIPIFFDTFFMLLIPIAQALGRRTGKNYAMYVLAICSGGIVTHSLVAPHPGPLAMAESLKLDLGLTIVVGLAVGIGPLIAAWFTTKFVTRNVTIAPPEATAEDLKNAQKAESELPGFWVSLGPVLLPVLLIAGASALATAPAWRENNTAIASWIEVLGDRNMALLIGTILGIVLLLRTQKLSFRAVGAKMAAPLETAAVIILITSAGGAFGYMLRNAGVGDAVQQIASKMDINLILLAWTVSAVIRIAQGSATVAMLTTAAMLQPVLEATPPPYHPVYVFVAIGCGAFILSWMNDSGFWVVSKLSGFTEKETLRTFTVVLTVASVAGLLMTLAMSKALPMH